jgi:hemin uptake protein HemP
MANSSEIQAQPESVTGNTCVDEGQVLRIKSEDLLQQMREIEIDHAGRIYRLRVTQHNKLILTA